MITYNEAKKIAELEIQKNRFSDSDSLMIVDEMITETETAWIFPYNSAKFLKTKDIYEALGGNSPIFVSKNSGKVFTYPSSLSIKGMIEQHEELNQVWKLVIIGDSISTHELHAIKKSLNWPQSRLIQLKAQNEKILDTGSKIRLEKLKKLLESQGLNSEIKLSI